MKRVLIDCLSGFYNTAVIENGELIEFISEEKNKRFNVGNIYTGIIKKILPSKFAFIDIGAPSDSFLQMTDNKEKNIFNGGKPTVKCGGEIIVQIVKEGIGDKRLAVSSMITLSGKYIVLLFNDIGINISKKINDEGERKRLLSIGNEIIGKNSEDFGVIMRTNCAGADEKLIYEESKKLIGTYREVVKRGIYSKAPAEIYSSENETEKIIRDYIKESTDEIIINELSEYNNFILKYQGSGKVIFYNESAPIFDGFFIRKQIERIFHNKIWLKCGGFIIFDYTEACTVVDVNTGKCSEKDLRNTIFKTNIEAAKEIAKQLRLRNLSGIIIIDFVDMKHFEDTKEVIKILENEIKKDRVSVTVVGMTELGLMQVTRKKTRRPLLKTITRKCGACGGNGFIFNEYFISGKIKNEIYSVFASTIYKRVVLEAGEELINAFKGENDEYKIIEDMFDGKIEFNVIYDKNFNYYNLKKYKE